MKLTLRGAAEIIGVSHVAILKMVKTGKLVRNTKKKIDTDNPVNAHFFASKGITFEEEAKKPKIKKTTKPKKEKKEKPKKTRVEEEDTEEETEEEIEEEPERREFKQDFNNPIVRLEIQTKIANLKVKEADFKLKTIKTEEARGRLIATELVEELIFNTLSNIIQSYSSKPYSYLDKLLFMIQQNETKENIVKMLAEEYTSETKKIIETAKSKFERKKKEIIKGLKELDGKDTESN